MATGFGLPDLEALRLQVRDEVHPWRSAPRTIDAYQRDRSTRAATGDLPL
jgi:hypothetical protein